MYPVFSSVFPSSRTSLFLSVVSIRCLRLPLGSLSSRDVGAPPVGSLCRPPLGRGTLGHVTWLYLRKCHSSVLPSLRKGRFVRSGGRAVERRSVDRGDGGSIPPTTVSKLRQFRSSHICLCLSEDTLKAGGPFYLMSMPGEIKHPTQGVNV